MDSKPNLERWFTCVSKVVHLDLITSFDILNFVDVLMFLCDCVCELGSLINNPSRRGLLSRFKPRPILFFMNKICLNQSSSLYLGISS